jgi:hypothetical protein
LKSNFLFFLIFVIAFEVSAQQIPIGNLFLVEQIRRSQQLGKDSVNYSLSTRPIDSQFSGIELFKVLPEYLISGIDLKILPFYSQTILNTERPYGVYNSILIPNTGLQQYFSGGIFAKWKFIALQIQPEFVLAQNKPFKGFPNTFSDEISLDRFHTWNFGDFPERFGDSNFGNVWWGQSKLTFQYGAFEIGGSTQNIWWGPGQWNALLFSNNARGFPHLTLNTTKPAKTFLGSFETQLLIGKLASSNLEPSQFQELNNQYFKPLSSDWRYLNALMVSYNPKWVPGLYFGFGRTFQVYNEIRGNAFSDIFPVFEGFQKERFFDNGNSVVFDSNQRDQQVSLFGRYLSKKSKAELYFEFGRRDHAFNWREFLLNPEHARAYMLGFIKLIELPEWEELIQIRGEVTHQQESVNRYIRYPGLKGRHSWHMHDTQRGFSNFGEPLGVGIGPGSNVQTLEVSLINNLDKIGLLLERLANNQDFYYRAFGQQSERKPWIDLSLGFLYDKQFNNLLLSSKLQLIHARNYQWQLDPASTPDFPKGENLTSVMGQLSLIYFWKRKEGK